MANSSAVLVPNAQAPVIPGIKGMFSTVWYLFFQALGYDIPQIGDCIVQAKGAPTNNYLKCDGSAVSREIYSALFSVIGTSYGPGDGSTTFNLPNLASIGGVSFWKIRYQ